MPLQPEKPIGSIICAQKLGFAKRNKLPMGVTMQYTLQPIKPLEEAYFEQQLWQAEAHTNFRKAMKKFEKKGGKLNEAIDV